MKHYYTGVITGTIISMCIFMFIGATTSKSSRKDLDNVEVFVTSSYDDGGNAGYLFYSVINKETGVVREFKRKMDDIKSGNSDDYSYYENPSFYYKQN